MLFRYRPNEEGMDLLAAQLWMTMQQTGDLENIFGVADLTLSQFLGVLGRCETYFDTDEAGQVWFALWFSKEDLFACTSVSIWTRQEPGRRLLLLKHFRELVGAALDNTPGNILGSVTLQPKLVPLFQSLGYTLVGKIPRVGWGKDCFVFYLTRENFEARWRKKSRQKRLEELH